MTESISAGNLCDDIAKAVAPLCYNEKYSVTGRRWGDRSPICCLEEACADGGDWLLEYNDEVSIRHIIRSDFTITKDQAVDGLKEAIRVAGRCGDSDIADALRPVLAKYEAAA